MAELMFRVGLRRWLIAAFLACAAGVLQAAGPVDLYAFDSEADELRFRQLIAELRCPKCLNTNLAGSDAPIAADLRRTVHRLIEEEGMSDAEILSFLQARYGDFVLYNPPFRPDTWILWLGPVVFLLLGGLVLWRMLRQPPGEALSRDEVARARSILERD
jgi:cytochrome c-type biogenesis protein CcmH